jgi:cytochrome c551/c552
MKRISIAVLAAMLLLSTAAFVLSGGWAVVSVSKVPDAWIVGKPLQLSWQVRGHGTTPLAGLKPTIEARSGTQQVTGSTWEFSEDGQRGYRGTIMFPDRGDWQVTIHSGLGRSRAVLIPWRVVDSIKPVRGTVESHLSTIGVAPLAAAERGRRMFAAKGCVACHVHSAVPIAGELSDFGPDLTDRRFDAKYLARFLADPSIKPPTNGKRMPNLALREKDIAPLIAFINAERVAAKR